MNTGNNKKKFYTIGEVSDITGVKPSVLRFWEEEFEELSPAKTKFGHRAYSKSNIDLIITIKKLLYEEKFTIKGAKSYLKKNKSEVDLKIIKDKLMDVLSILKENDNITEGANMKNDSNKNLNEDEFINAIKNTGNGDVFYFWNELSPNDKKKLIGDLQSIDFTQIDDFYQNSYLNRKKEDVLFEPTDYLSVNERDASLKNIGVDSLLKGEVAILTVAGGQASRLDYDYPKGCYPISPVKRKSLFQIFAEKIYFYSKFYKSDLTWLIMTSEYNYSETVKFFEENDYFNLSKDKILFFKQGALPTITTDNKLILKDKMEIYKNPDGHGGILTALLKTGLLAELKSKNVKYISYFQVDNPLVDMADPYFIGYHIKNNFEVTTKVIKKLYPGEKLGSIGKKNGVNGVIEYSDMPDELANQKKENGELKYLMGSIGIHIFNTEFLINFTEKLPVHAALKKVDGYKKDQNGNFVLSELDAIKFETFVFDSITLARRSGFFETERAEEFYPLKNKTGLDSIETCISGQKEAFRGWLIKSGIIDEAATVNNIEISPLFAPTKEIFLEKYSLSSDKLKSKVFNKDGSLKDEIYIE
ncbi:MAG TPA: UTP--glucose-1-phosphate uridylyltransferase [Spirochaetota bacterium]|jgi:UDP-N-acetylglucosamine/UDP-N-acetylgalactosamine diphosphorylase|nr:MAG: putative uridylyltransferase [Spirochaetes bacterium ADurb.Bin133]HNZ26845.1 UTP--glucose-1-phosphate uridylyltransferase [Spirochaetota bacterium]HQB60416.1 UTP--glucose-1-phosphate uridylyltransferase [Spirochaetota bacterium]